MAVDLVDPAPDGPLPLPGSHALPEHALFIVLRGWGGQEQKRKQSELAHLESDLLRASYSILGCLGVGRDMGGSLYWCRDRHTGWGKAQTVPFPTPAAPSVSTLSQFCPRHGCSILPQQLRVVRVWGQKAQVRIFLRLLGSVTSHSQCSCAPSLGGHHPL